jgi:hypothetical protein
MYIHVYVYIWVYEYIYILMYDHPASRVHSVWELVLFCWGSVVYITTQIDCTTSVCLRESHGLIGYCEASTLAFSILNIACSEARNTHCSTATHVGCFKIPKPSEGQSTRLRSQTAFWAGDPLYTSLHKVIARRTSVWKKHPLIGYSVSRVPCILNFQHAREVRDAISPAHLRQI